MDRDQWAEKLETFGWLCGHCQKGHLQLDRKLLNEMATADTKAEIPEDYWEPEMGQYRFAALVVCNACGDPVAVGGYATVDRQQVDWDRYEIEHTYIVRSISPPPLPFPLPENFPDPVAKHLRAAAGLLWSDHDAAGNKIRQAVEAMLDERGIKKTYIKAAKPPATRGQRKPQTLHTRIEMYRAKNKNAANAAEHLMAIKWIGNEGSHSGGETLTREQILDALEIMEVVLQEIYVGHLAKVAKKVAKIVKHGKPLKAPKTRKPTKPPK